jgi:hypothetical protein
MRCQHCGHPGIVKGMLVCQNCGSTNPAPSVLWDIVETVVRTILVIIFLILALANYIVYFS